MDIKRLLPLLIFLISLSACNQSSNLKSIIAVEGISVAKDGMWASMNLEISASDNLAKEMDDLSNVTYQYLICPIGNKESYSPVEDAHFAFMGVISTWHHSNNIGQFDVGKNKYLYNVRGNFEDTTVNEHPRSNLSRKQVIKLIEGRKQLSCRVVIMRYFSTQYLSNVFYIPVNEVLVGLNKAQNEE